MCLVFCNPFQEFSQKISDDNGMQLRFSRQEDELLTCGVLAEDVRRGVARLAVAGSVDRRDSELVLAALQQATDLQTGVIDGVGLVNPCPPGPEIKTIPSKKTNESQQRLTTKKSLHQNSAVAALTWYCSSPVYPQYSF